METATPVNVQVTRVPAGSVPTMVGLVQVAVGAPVKVTVNVAPLTRAVPEYMLVPVTVNVPVQGA